MITQIQNLPSNMVGFRATGTVTEEDFTNTVMPQVEGKDNLNYLLVLDTSLKNFSAGAWWKDMLMGLKNLTKWNRVAIIAEGAAIKTFNDVFSVLAPGEYKTYSHTEMQQAIDWVSGKTV